MPDALQKRGNMPWPFFALHLSSSLYLFFWVKNRGWLSQRAMSGFEVVGVVFALLPIFFEAGKLYSQSAVAARQATSPEKRDEKLAEFYDTFWWDVFILRRQMERVVSNLPHLSEERKQAIIASRSLDNWDGATDVGQALRDFFLSPNDYLAFQKVMSKVLSLFDRLVKDDSAHISMLDMVSWAFSHKKLDHLADV